MNQFQKNKTLILLTKKFPFGHQETYLFNELPFLEKAFEKIIVVPYDEYNYKEGENRIVNNKNIELYPVNLKLGKLNTIQLIKRELAVWNVMFFELLKGREPLNHLKYFKRNCSQIRHSYASAVLISNYLKETKTKNFVFYNYWLHGGVLISVMVNRLLRSINNNIISRAHAYDVYHKDWYSIYPDSPYLFLPFEAWKIHHAFKIATISTHGFDHFLKLYPALKNKFTVARLGVLDKCSNQISKKDSTLIWMTCSNIDENKRVYMIPELISKMKYDIKWFHFGMENSIKDKLKLETEIDKHKVGASCEILGLKQNSEVIEFYNTHFVDLFLNLSQIEGIPVSLMEAASFGVPMVATNTVGNPEIVNNENGFLIDVNFNLDELVNKLNEFFSSSELITQKRRASRQTFLDKYNAEKNYPQFIETLLLN